MTTIAHVNPETGYSGGEVQVFLLMEALRRRGYGNVLFCPAGSRSDVEARRRSFPVVTARLRNNIDVWSVVRLARAFRTEGVSLVHLHTGRANWLGGLAARRAGLPTLSTRRMDRTVKRSWRMRFIYRSLINLTVAISPAVRDALIAAGVAPERIRLIWDAVDPDEFSASGRLGSERKVRGSSDGARVSLTMAALVRRKGIDVLIDAIRLLRERNATWHAWIAGEGPEQRSLEQAVKAAGLEDCVHFLGWRSDKADLLREVDAFVLPSRREGVGVAALEAMAAGVPVVASRVGGLAQAVVDGETGILVEPEQPQELADALQALGGDPALGMRLGSNGRRRVVELFAADKQAEQYVEVYDDVLAAAKAR